MNSIKKQQLIALSIAWIILFILPLIGAIVIHSWMLVIFPPAISIFGLILATIEWNKT